MKIQTLLPLSAAIKQESRRTPVFAQRFNIEAQQRGWTLRARRLQLVRRVLKLQSVCFLWRFTSSSVPVLFCAFVKYGGGTESFTRLRRECDGARHCGEQQLHGRLLLNNQLSAFLHTRVLNSLDRGVKLSILAQRSEMAL